MNHLRPAGTRLPAWALFAALSALAIGGYFLVRGDVAQTATYTAIEFAAVLAIVAGVVRHRPQAWVAWLLLAGGVSLTIAGDVAYDAVVLTTGSDPESPSLADFLYLSSYPLLGAALLLLAWRQLARSWRSVLDAVIVLAGIGTPIWIYLIEPPLDRGELTGGALAVTVAYPCLDLLLVAVLATALMTGAARAPSYSLLIAGTITLAISDGLYVHASEGGYALGSWIDAGWLVAFALYGTAALHPSMVSVSSRPGRASGGPSLGRLGILLAAALITPAVLVVETARGEGVQLDEVVMATVAVALLVVRLVSLVVDVERTSRAEVAARREAEAAQRRLAEQNVQLRELDRAKDEFITLVSHDLRTPLTSIIGYLELLLDEESDGEPLTAQQRKFLATIGRNSDRLMTLVNDLLFVARLQAGRDPISHELCDLDAIVRRTVEMLRPQAAAKQLELTLARSPTPPITGDAERLARVVENLLSNAVKFTPTAGRVSVRVGLEDGFVTIEVADTGIGMSAEDQLHLYDRFFRAATAVKLEIQGTGLGLYMAQSIVQAHKGSISVASEVGKGSTFVVRLPLDEVRERAAPAPPSAAGEARATRRPAPAGLGAGRDVDG